MTTPPTLSEIESTLHMPRNTLASFVHKHPRRWPRQDLRKKCWEWPLDSDDSVQETTRFLYHDRLNRHYRLLHSCGNPACVNPAHHVSNIQRVNRPSIYDQLERRISYIKTAPGQICWIWTGSVTYHNVPRFKYRNQLIEDAILLVSELHGQILRPGQHLVSTCHDPMCVNPHHHKPSRSPVYPNPTN